MAVDVCFNLRLWAPRDEVPHPDSAKLTGLMRLYLLLSLICRQVITLRYRHAKPDIFSNTFHSSDLNFSQFLYSFNQLLHQLFRRRGACWNPNYFEVAKWSRIKLRWNVDKNTWSTGISANLPEKIGIRTIDNSPARMMSACETSNLVAFWRFCVA